MARILAQLKAWGFDVQHLTSKQMVLLACAGMIGLLLISMFFRKRKDAVPRPPAVKKVVEPPPPAKPPALAETVPQAPVEASVPAAAPAPTVAVVPGSVPAPAPVSLMPTAATAARVLATGQRVDIELPRVDPADTPLAGNSDRTFGPLNPTLALFLPETDARRAETRLELMTAGRYLPHAMENLQALRYVLMFAGLILAGTALIVLPKRLEPWALGALFVLPLLGWAVPRLWVKSEASQRRSEIEKGMPDMLDMLNMCVSQGMTMPSALERVSVELETVHPALHKELKIVSEQTKIGSLDIAMHNFRRRIDVPEVHSFSNLMMQTERMGTSVSQALAEYSDSMRAALKQRADEKGNRAAFKLLFPTVMCLMPAIYMFLLGPAVISFSKNWVTTQTRLRESTQRLNDLNPR